MSELKRIYDSLVSTEDLPSHYSGDWALDKNKFEAAYLNSESITDIEYEDDFDEFDDSY